MKQFAYSRLMRCLNVFLWRATTVIVLCCNVHVVYAQSTSTDDISNVMTHQETSSVVATSSDTETPQDTDKIEQVIENNDYSSHVENKNPTKQPTSIQEQVTQILQQQAKIQPLNFDDLEQYDVGAVDVNMLNEIYQVAEQAKKDAEVWQETGKRATPKPTVIASESVQNINTIPPQHTVPQVDVNQLMQEIQQDSQIVVESVQNNEQDDIFQRQQPQETKKQSRFARWKEQRALNSGTISKIKYIEIDVLGTQDKTLKENIEATLGSITVDAFQDYSALLPQLRKMANQASQAVGYYDAEFQFKKLSDNRLSLQVNAKNPVLVKEQNIEFTGAGEYLPQFQIINIVPDLEPEQIFHHGLYTQTKERIEQASQNNGFFDAYWRMHDVKVSLPENTADILLKYETGERYHLGDVEFRMSNGEPLPVNESVLKALIPWKNGDDYTSWRATLLSNHLSNTRYFNTLNVNVIIPEPKEKRIEIPPDIQAVLDKQGISEKQLEQQNIAPQNTEELSEYGFAGVNELEQKASTEPILTSQLDENQQEIIRLQQQARESKKIPVIVTLTADKLNQMEIGLGYGSDTGARLRTQYRRAIVNRFGHHLLANMEVSKIRQAIDSRYNIPYPHPINQYIALIAGYERESDFSVGQGMSLVSESAVAGAEYLMKSNRFDAWQHALGLRYRLDRLHVNGNVPITDIPQEFLAVRGADTQQSLLLSYKASKIYADSAVNPVQGFKQHYKIELGSKDVLSDVDMAILTAGWAFIFSMGENNNHQFIGRADASYMFTNNFAQVPYNLRFFAGGDQSLRGFDYKSLSPTINGLKVGGQILAVGSLEYNYQVREGWRVGIFSDFGNSFDKDLNTPIAYSAGLGLRWQSPVGPIRFDIASGLSDDNHPIRLHFFIGSPL